MTCFVTGCDSGYRKRIRKNKLEGKRNPSLFLAPVDADTFALWKRMIPRQDRSLTHKDKVCSLHFYEEDLIKCDLVKLKDGSVWQSDRINWALKKEAVPRIFPHCPSYLLDKKNERKGPLKRQTTASDILIPVKQRKLKSDLELDYPEVPEVSAGMLDSSEISAIIPNLPTSADEPFSFELLKQKLCDYVLPNLWTLFSNHNHILFVKVKGDPYGIFEKRISIAANLKIKTYPYLKEMNLEKYHKLENFSDVQDLVNVMDTIQVPM